MEEQTIDQAVRAMGRALAAGADHKAAMRAALKTIASTGCLNEFHIKLHGVDLVVGFAADIEDEWFIKVAPGVDLAPLLMESNLAGAIDVLLVKAMKRETDRDALDRIEERHAELRELAGVL